MPPLARGLSILAWTTLAFLLLPSLVIVPTAFSDSVFLSFPPEGFSFRWFSAFFSSTDWLESTTRSVRIGIAVSVVATAVATVSVLALMKCGALTNKIVRVCFIAPMALPVIVYAVSVYGLYVRIGLIGTDLGLIMAHTILALPFPFLTVSAAVATMDQSLPRAAASCGATPLKTFWWVTLPIIKPGLAAGALFAFLTSFDEVVVAMFIGGVDATLPKRMLDDIRYELSPVLAAIATLLTCITALIVLSTNKRRLPTHSR